MRNRQRQHAETDRVASKLLQTKEAIDAAADLPQFPAKRTNERHAYRPGNLNVLDVLADDLPVFRIQSLSATHGPAHRR